MAQPSAQELARQELEWRKCFRPDLGPIDWDDHPKKKASALAEAFIYWVTTYVYIFNKVGGEPIPFHLWDIGTGSQKRAARELLFHRLIIILKTRQFGLSWLLCAYTVWRVMREGNIHAYFQSIGQREVNEQVERMVFIYEHLPEWMRARNPLGGRGRKDNDSLKQFKNRSAIHALATTKRAGHGAAPSLYGLDEFARNEQDRMVWRAVKPALGTKGQVVIVSTANGMGNLFQELWFDAIAGNSGFCPLFFPASDHPDYTPEFLERERRDYAGDIVGFLEAYPMTWQDAFQTSSRCPFDPDRIKDQLSYIRKNHIKPKVGRLVVRDNGDIAFEEDRVGPLMVWKEPRQSGPKARIGPGRYTIGADVAEGLTNGDWSAAVVLDVTTNEVVALFRQKIPPEYYGAQLERLARWYNDAFLAVEVNKLSEVIISDLKESYHNLYCRERRERIYDQPTLEVGFYSSSKTKGRIIVALRREFHDPDHPLRIYSEVILNEMSTFEEDARGGYGASGQNKDDTVIALAIAIEAKRTMPPPPKKLKRKKIDWRSL